ncbi:MAG: hypothetical protein JRI46_04075 [Deltaproteobacteria bacterium]|nr:hypothetical protein [Deltaproteobacteria bacterium]
MGKVKPFLPVSSKRRCSRENDGGREVRGLLGGPLSRYPAVSSALQAFWVKVHKGAYKIKRSLMKPNIFRSQANIP